MKESTAPQRDDLHLPRRLFHMASGCGIVGSSFLLPTKNEFVWFLFFLTLVDLIVEISRLFMPRVNAWTLHCFRSVLREGEQTRLSGVFFYLVGCTLAALVFPRDVAVLSILFLAFGDPIASLVGVRFGRMRLPPQIYVPFKSLEGSAACFVFCFFMTFGVSFVLGRTVELALFDRLLFALIGGFSAVVGELLPLRTDDNLAMPLVAGALLWAMAAFFNLYPGLYL